MKVLQVTDGADDDGVLADALLARGHEVVTATTDAALDRLNEDRFDLVFVRARPVHAGASLPEWIGAQEGARGARIVCLLPRADVAALAGALPAGASDFLLEPLDAGILPLRLAALERAPLPPVVDADDPWADVAWTLVHRAPLGLVLVRPGRSFLASPALARLTGYSTAELADLGNRDAARLIHPEDRPALLAEARARLTADADTSWQRFRLLKRDGGVVWVESYSIRTDYRGEPATLICYLDSTQRRAREAELEARTGVLRAWLRNLPVLVAAVGDDATFRLWNQEAARVTGWTEAALLEHEAPLSLIFPEDDEREYLLDLVTEQRGKLRDLQTEVTCKDGSLRQIAWSAVRVPEAVDTVGALYVGIDVTEAHNAQAELARSEERYRNLVDQAPEAIVVLDADTGQFADANPAAEALFGLPLARLVETGPTAFSPPVQPDGRPSDEASLAFIAEALEGNTPRFDWVHRNVDGVDIPTEILLARLPHDDRNLIRGTITDVSWRRDAQAERAALEEALRHSQKMEAIGRLAGGVAHDFNNLLTGILAHAHDLRTSSADGSPVYRAARTIERAADRAAELTRQLLGFARRGKYQTVAVNLDEAIQDVSDLVARTIDRRVRIVTDVAEKAVAIGDPGQMQQVLLNLVLNAVDAMPDGGRLKLSVRQVEVGPDATIGHDGARPGAFAQVVVSDTGQGMTEEVKEFIFEPFFTTKAAGEGTGMGLATVWGIVDNHGGWVDVDSAPGEGTTFTVWLPAAESITAEVPAAEDTRTTNRLERTVHVLVVDDEPVVRDSVSTLLTSLGYEVRAEPGGATAVAWFAANAETTDVVLLDLMMPGMDGRETFEALKAIDPLVRVVLSTGFGLDDTVQAVLDSGMRGFVQKPFRIAQLVEVLEEAMR